MSFVLTPKDRLYGNSPRITSIQACKKYASLEDVSPSIDWVGWGGPWLDSVYFFEGTMAIPWRLHNSQWTMATVDDTLVLSFFWSWSPTLPETNSSHLPGCAIPKGDYTIVFQPSIFRGELLVSGRVFFCCCFFWLGSAMMESLRPPVQSWHWKLD